MTLYGENGTYWMLVPYAKSTGRQFKLSRSDFHRERACVSRYSIFITDPRIKYTVAVRYSIFAHRKKNLFRDEERLRE